MSEQLGFNPEEEVAAETEIPREKVIEVCRSYTWPDGYLEELEALEDTLELIGTASIWIQEEGYDLDEFLERIGAYDN